MTIRTRLIAIAIALVSFCWVHSAQAQEDDDAYTMVLRGLPLHQALEELVRVTRIDLIYTSELVADKTVYCTGRRVPAETLLRCVLSGSGLDYVRSSSGTYVLIDALRERPRFGDIAGRILDSATGEPLPYASVLLADASSGTTTDGAGFFNFSSVLSGTHRIFVTYVGYRTAVDSVHVEAGDRNRIEIALDRTPVSLEPIVIDGLAQRLPSRGLGSNSTEGDHLLRHDALGTADVARAAATVPGVSVQPPLADVHIQGSDAGEHLTLLDGVPVRDPVTLGRHLSAFSPLALDRMTVHKAGFGASHGSHLSGLVELDHDVSSGDGWNGAFRVDPLSFNGKVQGRAPLSRSRSADGMIAVRTSVWDVFRDPGLESLLDRWNAVDPILAGIWIREPVTASSLTARRHHPDLSFSDVHAAARVDLSAFHMLHASAYHASNRIASELAAVNDDGEGDLDRLMATRDDYDWSNWAGQVRQTWLVNARSIATLQVKASGHSSQYLYLSLHEEAPKGMTADELDSRMVELRTDLENTVGSDEENRVGEVAAKASFSRSFAPGHHLDLGLEATHIDSRFQLGNQFVAPFMHDANAWEIAGYAEDRLSLGLETSLEPGLRLTYLPSRRTLYAEPRLAIRHDRASGPVGPYALRLAGGLYRQFLPSFTLTSSGSTSVVPFVRFWIPVDRSLAPPRAYHLAGEALLMPSERWSIGLEAYSKWQPRLLELDYLTLLADHAAVRPRPPAVRMQQSDFVTPTSGRALGGSIRVEYANRRFQASMQYAVSSSKRRYPGRFDGILQPVPWNVPHEVIGAGRFNVTSSLAVHVEGEASWGRSWPFRRAYYDYLELRTPSTSFAPFMLEDPTTPQLPAYYRIDPGFTYDLELSTVQLRFKGVLVNALDRRNVYDWSVESEAGRSSPIGRLLPGRRPIFSVRLVY